MFRAPARRAALAALLSLAAACGCKSAGGGSGDKPPGAKGDPILGMRLPPQDVPTAGKTDLAGAKRDPLLKSPADRSRDTPNGHAAKPAPGEVSALPPRTGLPDDDRVPYRPGPEASPAALAGGTKADDTLTLNRRPVTASIVHAPEAKADELTARATRTLRDYNATWSKPERTADGYTVTVQRSMSARNNGPFRKYEGVGATPTAALLSAAEQVRNDVR